MILQPYVYAYLLDSIIGLISFSCLFFCNLRRCAWYSDILVDYLRYYKLLSVMVRA